MIIRYIMDEFVKFSIEIMTLHIKVLLSWQNATFTDDIVKNIFLLFGSISGVIFAVSLMFSFGSLNLNKIQGRGSYAEFMKSIFLGILHVSFAIALLPACYLILSKVTLVLTNSYLDLNTLTIKKETIDAVISGNVYALFGGQEVFIIYFLFVFMLAFRMVKIMFMFIENMGIIVVQTCIFAILVFDTVNNEGVGTMKFFKVAIGTIIGQMLMIVFSVIGLVMMFNNGTFILGIGLYNVCTKLPELVPNYLGSTGKLMATGKSFSLNTGMLTSAVRMGANAVA